MMDRPIWNDELHGVLEMSGQVTITHTCVHMYMYLVVDAFI